MAEPSRASRKWTRASDTLFRYPPQEPTVLNRYAFRRIGGGDVGDRLRIFQQLLAVLFVNCQVIDSGMLRLLHQRNHLCPGHRRLVHGENRFHVQFGALHRPHHFLH